MSQGRQRRTGTSRATSLLYQVCPSKPLGNLGTSRGSNLAWVRHAMLCPRNWLEQSACLGPHTCVPRALAMPGRGCSW